MTGVRSATAMHDFKNTSFLILMCFSMLYGYSQTQENPYHKKILGKLASYTMKHSPEKVYLHTDKSIYTNGETIWYKAYLVDGILHKASEKSEVVYVELWNGDDTLIIRQKLIVEGLGSQGSIKIPINIKNGNLLIRAYTKYMLNEREPTIFQKEIPVYAQEFGDYKNPDANQNKEFRGDSRKLSNPYSENNRPIINFFPEGGHLVTGLTSVMGVKTVGQQGNGLALEGTIQDGKGNTAGFFKSYEAGLGKVTFVPEAGKDYEAVILYGEKEYRFPIPKALPKGYVLSIRNNGDHLIANVSTNSEEGLEGTLLIGHFRGDLFFERLGKTEDGASYSVKLNTDRLFDGVAHFTLFTASGKPICERLVFIDHPKNSVELEVSSDSRTYGPRETVTVDLSALDTNGTQLKGDFSLSVVTTSNQLPESMADTNIKSWLLLNSDLGNSVEDASYFFENDSRERKYVLDALMLTHGWRRFVWNSFLDDTQGQKTKYIPEKAMGTLIEGFTALTGNPKARKASKVSLRIPALKVIEEKSTDQQGRFSFGPYEIDDGTETYLEIVDTKTKSKKKKKKEEISIFMGQGWSLPQVKRKKKLPIERKARSAEDGGHVTDIVEGTKNVQEYLLMAYRKKSIDFTYDPTITQLEEVEVSAPKKTRTEERIKEIESKTLHGSATIRLFADSTGTAGMSAIDLIGRAPGVTISGVKPEQAIKIRGLSGVGSQLNFSTQQSFPGSTPSNTTPLIFVDGGEVNLDYIQHMDASEILFVDVLRGIEASIYGLRGYNGVIVIATKSRLSKGSAQNNVPEYSETKIPGFYMGREFFSPDYSFVRPDHQRLDYRTTLFWKPDIRIEDSRQPRIQFYTGDTTGNFVIKVEGITKDGRAVVGQKIFEVQN
ncbi:TonB-dependent receptor plug domain-containing protein [Ulvibacterium sp.]|uniref:TonB-dependent receptor plug domain-containing protein n=1 Tax=Ulvibacterium sp. TaxID=2665914 RepID=UPI003CC56752